MERRPGSGRRQYHMKPLRCNGLDFFCEFVLFVLFVRFVLLKLFMLLLAVSVVVRFVAW